MLKRSAASSAIRYLERMALRPEKSHTNRAKLSSRRHLEAQPAVEERRWRAVVTRENNLYDPFVYCVKTTGIYCRPSCASRRPKRDHVSFCENAVEAEAAGFRSCKRCKPNEQSHAIKRGELITSACRALAETLDATCLDEVAREADISARHLRRIFLQHTGVSPRAYTEALRRNAVQRSLGTKSTVTSAMLDAGFNSSGRFYERTDAMLGMRPSQARSGGDGVTLRFAVTRCSLGYVLVAASDKGIAAIDLGQDRNALVMSFEKRFPHANLVSRAKDFDKLVTKVVNFVEQPDGALDLPLDIRGTAFQQRVWNELQKLDPGTTASYSDIAKQIGAPKAVRAVASAIAANVLAIAIPCHRVVRADGSLSGYRWGPETKRQLLERERKVKM